MDSQTPAIVVVARIVKTHSIHGEVVLESLTDVEGRLEDTPAFLLIDKAKNILRELEVESRRFFNGRHVLKFRGIDTMSQAVELRSLELAVREEDIGTLPADSYFIHDLIGMKVCLLDGREIGTVADVVETGGGQALLEVGKEDPILIPFVSGICVEVDEAGRTIKIDPPEGLLRLNAR